VNRKKVIMSPIEMLKAEAMALRESEKALGRSLKHCDALERVARNHGYASWRACSAVLAALAPAVPSAPPADNTPTEAVEMKRYKSSKWSFALDIPKRWNTFPTVPANSPYEVVRFASYENGVHLAIIFRAPHDTQKSLQEISDGTQERLAKTGFGNFAGAETVLGSRKARILDFDRPRGEGVWYCREYFAIEDTLLYTLGFGTTERASMFELYDRMAQTFVISKG
jgi:hypothetical protein